MNPNQWHQMHMNETLEEESYADSGMRFDVVHFRDNWPMVTERGSLISRLKKFGKEIEEVPWHLPDNSALELLYRAQGYGFGLCQKRAEVDDVSYLYVFDVLEIIREFDATGIDKHESIGPCGVIMTYRRPEIFIAGLYVCYEIINGVASTTERRIPARSVSSAGELLYGRR